MRLIHAVRTVMASGVAALLLAGCGPGKPSTPAATAPNAVAPTQEVGELKQIGLAYHTYWSANSGKGPAKIDDLYPYVNGPGSPPSQGLASGKYKLYLNAPQSLLTTGMGNTVLGYYESVPTKGGPVLMTYGGVQNMTADEFKNAPKAGQ
jgi:hypothetical protein